MYIALRHHEFASLFFVLRSTTYSHRFIICRRIVVILEERFSFRRAGVSQKCLVAIMQKTAIENFSSENNEQGLSLMVDYVIGSLAIGFLSSACYFKTRAQNQHAASPSATRHPRLSFLKPSSDLNYAVYRGLRALRSFAAIFTTLLLSRLVLLCK